jgi:hypothetical protein
MSGRREAKASFGLRSLRLEGKDYKTSVSGLRCHVVEACLERQGGRMVPFLKYQIP